MNVSNTYIMKIFILPDSGVQGVVDYAMDTDTMWVYASLPPRRYKWHMSSHDSDEIEILYLTACLAANQWLRIFESPKLIVDYTASMI